MFKYFLKLEFRNLIRNKYISILKITGLVIGLWVFMVSGYYVLHESSFDHFQSNTKDKYLLDVRDQFGDDYFSFSLPYPLINSLQNRYPEVVKKALFESKDNTIYIKKDEGFIKSDKSYIGFVEEEFFDFFSFDFIVGSAKNSFTIANPIIISEEIADKYFRGINSVGKTISVRIADQLFDFTISGIIKNPPSNSNVNFHWIGSLPHLMNTTGKNDYVADWEFRCKSYIQLTPGTNPNEFCNKLIKEYVTLAKLESSPTIASTPLLKIHVQRSAKKRINVFSTLGILILIISVINYVLLSTVESTQKIKHLGIEKISGAQNRDFLIKNIASILLYSILAFTITIGLFYLAKPYFPKFLSGSFSPDLNLSIVIFSLLGTIFGVIFLASFINNIINGSQKPINILKNKYTKGKTGKVVFNSLLTFQLIAFIALITSSVFIHKQLNFMQKSKLGFNQESLLTIKVAPEDVNSYQAFKEELLRNPIIKNVAGTSAPPLSNNMSIYGFISVDSLGKQHIKVIEYIHVDRDFFNTLQLGFREGGSFPESAAGYCAVNQTFIEERKIEKPLVDKVELGGKEYKICGIINDFHHQSMRSKITPFVAYLNPGQIAFSLIRFSGNPLETVKLIKETAGRYLPNTIFEYEFMDERIKTVYLEEERFRNIIIILTFLSILISSLGLLGLSYFSSLVRIKEIGIRKVNGAKVSEILTMLNKDFIKWVTIAFVIACPIAYFAMNKWLENFAYKTTLSWWIFALAGVLALGIALLTVSWQSWRAATRNPVEALRYE